MKKISNLFARMTTRTLIIIPYFLAFICMGLSVPIGRASPFLHFIMFPLTWFFFGLAGIPMIIRKEAIVERDGWAVLLGIIHLVIGWGLAFIVPIYNIFFR